ncbi:MAG: hypothetical protein JRI80_00335 [Deltaproteobacteria bacterium]|nr:hypothetical protein [Deltaproteobacteria bacterium]
MIDEKTQDLLTRTMQFIDDIGDIAIGHSNSTTANRLYNDIAQRLNNLAAPAADVKQLIEAANLIVDYAMRAALAKLEEDDK